MLISGFDFIGCVFCVLVFASSLGFSESVMSVCYLFYWSAQLVCSKGMTAGVGGWDSARSQEREVKMK